MILRSLPTQTFSWLYVSMILLPSAILFEANYFKVSVSPWSRSNFTWQGKCFGLRFLWHVSDLMLLEILLLSHYVGTALCVLDHYKPSVGNECLSLIVLLRDLSTIWKNVRSLWEREKLENTASAELVLRNSGKSQWCWRPVGSALARYSVGGGLHSCNLYCSCNCEIDLLLISEST